MTTVRQMLGFGVLCLVVALSFNAARGGLNLTKQYFDAPAKVVATNDTGSDTGGGADEGEAAPSEPESPYQMLSFDQVVEAYHDSLETRGAYLFVDARSADAFADGHIPGAVQCNRYLQADTSKLLSLVLDENGDTQVDHIIVYCNGGSCDDSRYVCRDLTDAFVRPESICLFKGGWEEWTANKMPIALGQEETTAYDWDDAASADSDYVASDYAYDYEGGDDASSESVADFDDESSPGEEG